MILSCKLSAIPSRATRFQLALMHFRPEADEAEMLFAIDRQLARNSYATCSANTPLGYARPSTTHISRLVDAIPITAFATQPDK
jgi:hypothetical protein